MTSPSSARSSPGCVEALTVIVPVRRNPDPADRSPRPDNVHLERYIPLSLALPHCHLVETNGGSGTLTAAVAHGLPVVVVPVGADQPANAARRVVLGLGTVIAASELTPVLACHAVRAVHSDLAYREAAKAMREEINSLPGPEHAVALLEGLGAEKQPILGDGTGRASPLYQHWTRRFSHRVQCLCDGLVVGQDAVGVPSFFGRGLAKRGSRFR
jgi:Glycosyltransferase family 28 C-terminal domain